MCVYFFMILKLSINIRIHLREPPETAMPSQVCVAHRSHCRSKQQPQRVVNKLKLWRPEAKSFLFPTKMLTERWPPADSGTAEGWADPYPRSHSHQPTQRAADLGDRRRICGAKVNEKFAGHLGKITQESPSRRRRHFHRDSEMCWEK